VSKGSAGIVAPNHTAGGGALVVASLPKAQRPCRGRGFDHGLQGRAARRPRHDPSPISSPRGWVQLVTKPHPLLPAVLMAGAPPATGLRRVGLGQLDRRRRAAMPSAPGRAPLR